MKWRGVRWSGGGTFCEVKGLCLIEWRGAFYEGEGLCLMKWRWVTQK